MPPRNETVRDRSIYLRRCCKNCAPPHPIPSPDFAILCPFPSANGTCALSRGDVSLLLKPRSPRRYNGNVCAIFAFTTSQRRKIMKQQKKFSNHAMPARRPRKTQGKCVLFADAAKLYIEYSKAVTSAETAVKRMRFFAQFYNAAFAERDIASISPYVPPATARARPPQKQDTCRTTRSCLTTCIRNGIIRSLHEVLPYCGRAVNARLPSSAGTDNAGPE